MTRRSTSPNTNVLSELLPPNADAKVVDFVAAQEDLLVSAIVFHELVFGMSLLPQGRRKTLLVAGIEAFRLRFQDRIVAVDVEVARIAGQLRAQETLSGFEPDGMDALIAASAIRVSARLATRNTKDFLRTGVELVNPWTH